MGAIVFDLNETLLDLSALDPLFADAFGDKAIRRVWFAQALQLAMAMTITEAYAPFSALAEAALEMTARKRGVNLDGERAKRIMRGLAALPAHGDAPDGLARLQAAGYRLAVLAQAPAAALEEQLDRANLRRFFSDVLSADSVRRYKPARAAYAMAQEWLGGESPVLVTAHDWDAAGAMHAGWRVAFIARHGTSLNPLADRPAFGAPDLRELATTLVASVAR